MIAVSIVVTHGGIGVCLSARPPMKRLGTLGSVEVGHTGARRAGRARVRRRAARISCARECPNASQSRARSGRGPNHAGDARHGSTGAEAEVVAVARVVGLPGVARAGAAEGFPPQCFARQDYADRARATDEARRPGSSTRARQLIVWRDGGKWSSSAESFLARFTGAVINRAPSAAAPNPGDRAIEQAIDYA